MPEFLLWCHINDHVRVVCTHQSITSLENGWAEKEKYNNCQTDPSLQGGLLFHLCLQAKIDTSRIYIFLHAGMGGVALGVVVRYFGGEHLSNK